MLQITEIFKSIQGESSHAGLPCAFVRLTGCNLRCTWCDTEYAFHGGKAMTQEEVVAAVEKLFGNVGKSPTTRKLVEVTGGEPLLQEGVYSLMQAFIDLDYTVMLETGGSLLLDRVPEAVIKIVDLKAPGSGEVDKNRLENFEHLNSKDEIKFVLQDRTDYEWARSMIQRHQLQDKAGILMSPVFEQLDLRELAEWILEDQLPVRMQTQLHKHIWGKDTIGV
ncbi:MAG: radical SAM protein [Candidatus Nitronauta litoralis]|uniref:7-carboxy-7-deazaguanine synthase n=1 Tax=Candidatus Nitronauta litoralis TaxID=2705533 RepID=A0A7T0G0G7_9BACT|nr:MAG: radical SAM protein [Candidatus Nitronauta litoralis]